MLALGFTVSALAPYAALSFAGALLLGDARSTTEALLVAAAVMGLLLGLDGLGARRPGAMGPPWRRQTRSHSNPDMGSRGPPSCGASTPVWWSRPSG